ncbi:MAG: hypothetical protein PHQ13_01505 [Rhodoferax sp.]|nr:hypothetical protein [Rhodoferax sp.]
MRQKIWHPWGVALLLLTSTWSVNAALLDRLLAAGQPEFVELSDQSNLAEAFKQVFPEVAGLETVGMRKLVIGSFVVEFVTSQRVKSGAEVTYTLAGITPAQMQGMTDRLHLEFATLLKQRGYEVLPASVLVNSVYKTELAEPNEQPVVVDDTGSASDVAKTALDVVNTGSSAKGETQMASVIATAKGTAPKVFESKFLNLPLAGKAADETGLGIVQARLKLNFMQFDPGFTKIDRKPRNMLATKDSRMEVFWPASTSSQWALKTPVVLPHVSGEKITDLGMSTGKKAAAVAKGLFGAANSLLGFGASSGGGAPRFVAGSQMTQVDALASVGMTAHSAANSGNFEVAADADYEDKVTKDLALVLQLYTQALPK